MATVVVDGPRVIKSIRKIRHWKQRWDPKAAFVWRKETPWPRSDGNGEVVFPAGSVVPDWVVKTMGAKLRRFWESHRIELCEFEDPNVASGRVAGAKSEEPMAAPADQAPDTRHATEGADGGSEVSRGRRRRRSS